ncbi:hypothetical protein [Chryseobacterium sp. BIGb0232]|uniref:hypothetical protein n=1 Tax=Chryseobacterium sp. BIGb0232 TaxID=2940598 RepID=UPI000F4691FA|nr:hypothetical protein [Chryseobacterium sp. BIGb0232]MCS4305508.1 hypothetical protein [Chryseobacterium sp. BIGb0232]ROS06637.1 hypothetical protein EDF65_5183 [Chryseobacterium nakagawai]
MKIINKYPVFVNVVRIGKESFQFKFKKSLCFDYGEDFFVVNFHGLKIHQDAEEWIKFIKEDHMNMDSVITIDGNTMEIFTGSSEEYLWGDWCTSFSPFEFESYDTRYVQKEQKDWEDELLLTVRIQVLEKMRQYVMSPDFRDKIHEYCTGHVRKANLKPKQRERLTDVLEKISKLNAGNYYDIFVRKGRFDIN